MINPADIIIELRSTNSRINKEKIIEREMMNKNSIFFRGVSCAMNKLITFGIKQVPIKCGYAENLLDYMEFFDFLEDLKSRKITGNDARDKIKELMYKSSDHLWNDFYRLILIKDLKCGVTEKTINNCASRLNLPEYSIPVFSCQLASPSEKHQKKMTGKKVIDIKLDGVRLLTIVYPNGDVIQYTRNGKEVHNFGNIKSQFAGIASELLEPMVYDGEIVSKSFQDLMTYFFRKGEIDTTDSVLYLFDVIPLKHFSQGFCDIAQINRKEILQFWYNKYKNRLSNISVLEYEVLNLSDLHDYGVFTELNKWAIENHYEGIMIKDINAPYECSRTTSWLKLKPVITIDLSIIDMLEGENKYAGTLGAITCHGFDEDKEIFVNVGTGISDELRDKYWSKKFELIGKVIEIECDAITKNQDGKYSLRFPRFKRLRGFDIGEKI